MRTIALLIALLAFPVTADVWVADPNLEGDLIIYRTANSNDTANRIVAPDQEIMDIGESGDFWQATVQITTGQTMTGFILKAHLVDPNANFLRDLVLENTQFKWIGNDLYIKAADQVCFVFSLDDMLSSQNITEWKNGKVFFDELGGLQSLTSERFENCEFPEDPE